MHTPTHTPSFTRLHRMRRLALVTTTASTLLVACGGGGGGSSSGNASTAPDSSASTATTTAFPYGVALGSPTALVAASTAVGGSVGSAVNAAMAPQQGMASSLAEAVASGSLSLTGNALLSVSTLFDTSAPGQASCYGPAVGYVNHDDSSGSSGTLPAAAVAIWADSDNSSTPVPCAAAQLNARTQGLSAQTSQAMLLLGGLRLLLAADPTLTMPSAGASLDMLSRASSLLSPLLSGVTVNAASIAVNADASEYSYRLVLTRGSGASAQSIELNLLHTPNDVDTRFAGVLQMTLGYLSADASLGCNDQRDNGLSLYKVARLTTLGYNRQDNLLSLRARTGQYCGNPTLGSASHLNALAATTMSGELDPTVFLAGSTRGGTLGWRQGFARMSSDVVLSDLSSDFVYAWQDQPSGTSHARLFAGHSALDANTRTRSLALFHGYTDDITITDGTMRGMLCNAAGPGSTHTIVPRFQYQAMSLGPSASSWTLGTSNIRYAPTNNCNASATMRFDLDGNGAVSASEGSNFSNELHGLSVSSTDVQDELLLMGLLNNVLLP
jgi:hypothetical protein